MGNIKDLRQNCAVIFSSEICYIKKSWIIRYLKMTTWIQFLTSCSNREWELGKNLITFTNTARKEDVRNHIYLQYQFLETLLYIDPCFCTALNEQASIFPSKVNPLFLGDNPFTFLTKSSVKSKWIPPAKNYAALSEYVKSLVTKW